MNVNAVEEIWAAISELRAYVPTSTYVEIAVPLLVLIYLEEQQDYYRVPESARWSKLIKEGFAFKKRIAYAFDEIERCNYSLMDVFTTVWPAHDTHLEQLDDAILHRFALRLDRAKNRMAIDELMDALLNRMGEEIGPKGELFTPVSLVKLITSLLDINGNHPTVYDGATGYGRMLCEAWNIARDRHMNIDVFGQEKHPISRSIAIMNLILHGKHDAEITLGDTLRNPQLKDGYGLKTFDYVIMEPPFGLRDWGHEEAQTDLYGRFAYGVPGKSHGDMAFILHALSSLNQEGKAVIVVPQGVLFRGAIDGKIRSQLIQDDLLEAVISLPAGAYQHTAIPTAILIFNKQKQEHSKRKVFFIDTEELGEKKRGRNILSPEDVKNISWTYLDRREKEGFSRWVSINEIADKDFNLSAKMYFVEREIEVESKIGAVKFSSEDLDNAMPTVPLRYFAQLFRGMNAPKETIELEQATHKMILLSDVQEDQLYFEHLTPVEITDTKRATNYTVYPGDILVASRGTAFKIAIIPETKENLILSHNFIGIRPNVGVNPYFIKAYLESPAGQYYLTLMKKGMVMTVISTKDLEELPIPDLSLMEQEQIGMLSQRADEELAYRIKRAKEEHKEMYLDIYHKLGIAVKHEDIQ